MMHQLLVIILVLLLQEITTLNLMLETNETLFFIVQCIPLGKRLMGKIP
jgi:hypothetical protein